MEALPEGCLGRILALMTPIEAYRLATLSRTLRSMVNSNVDVVWKEFTLSEEDWEWVVSNALEPPPRVLTALSRKDLFVRLYRHGVHIDETVFFTYFTDEAMELFVGTIFVSGIWEFYFTLVPEDPISYLVESNNEIQCSPTLRTRIPNPNSKPLYVRTTFSFKTTYAIYLVFKLTHTVSESESESEPIMFPNPIQLRFYLSFGRLKQERIEHILVLDPRVKNFEEREDGWIEVEMIEFILNPSCIQIIFTLEERPTPHILINYSVAIKTMEVRPKLKMSK